MVFAEFRLQVHPGGPGRFWKVLEGSRRFWKEPIGMAVLVKAKVLLKLLKAGAGGTENHGNRTCTGAVTRCTAGSRKLQRHSGRNAQPHQGRGQTLVSCSSGGRGARTQWLHPPQSCRATLLSVKVVPCLRPYFSLLLLSA